MDSGVKVSKRKLSMRHKLGYGIGGFSDNLASVFVSSFFLFFLTEIAGIEPAYAGTIVFIAILWDAISDTIIGSFSDNLKCKYGRRRPLMLVMAVPLGLSLAALFINVNWSIMGKKIYYCVTALMFWTSFTMVSVPFNALGAELSDDFNDRNVLRFFSSIFTLPGIFCATSLPMIIVGIVSETSSLEAGWRTVGIVNGVLTVIAVLTCWFLTKGSEDRHINSTREKSKVSVFKRVQEIVKVKSYRIIVICSVIYCLGQSLVNGGIIYFFISNLGYNEGNMAFYYSVTLIMGIAILPIIVASANKFGKDKVFRVGMIGSGIGILIVGLIGINSLASVIILGLFIMIAQSINGTLALSMVFDCCELVEYSQGERLEGMITAIQSFAMKLGFAVGSWILGIYISLIKYVPNAKAQTPEVQKGLFVLMIVIVPTFYILSAIVLRLYKLDKSSFELLQSVLQRRQRGEDVTDARIDKLL